MAMGSVSPSFSTTHPTRNSLSRRRSSCLSVFIWWCTNCAAQSDLSICLSTRLYAATSRWQWLQVELLLLLPLHLFPWVSLSLYEYTLSMLSRRTKHSAVTRAKRYHFITEIITRRHLTRGSVAVTLTDSFVIILFYSLHSSNCKPAVLNLTISNRLRNTSTRQRAYGLKETIHVPWTLQIQVHST